MLVAGVATNTKTNVGLSYTHNALNQLTTITAQGISGSIRYQYDAQGRRTSKDVYGDTTQYLYDGEHVIAEYKNNQLSKRFIYATGTDNPIALISNNQTYYYHTDDIGSVVALSNSAGNIQEQYSYSPFGRSDDISLIGNPLRYTARRLDDETRHYYYRARYYEPSWGKFLQADPLGYQDGMNRYAYVGHSPTHLVDPMGTIAIAGGFSTSQGLVDTASMINNFTHITNQQVSNFLTTGSADPVNNLSQPNFGACNGCATPSFGPFDIAAVGAAVVNGVRAGAAYVGSRFAATRSANQIGLAGEEAVRASFNIGTKQRFGINGRYRIPDGVNSTTLSEVKNVKSLSYTQQLRDFSSIAKRQGLRYDLYVRPSTKLSGPLMKAIQNGTINLRFIPGAKR